MCMCGCVHVHVCVVCVSYLQAVDGLPQAVQDGGEGASEQQEDEHAQRAEQRSEGRGHREQPACEGECEGVRVHEGV
jgi:hypothetical protein